MTLYSYGCYGCEKEWENFRRMNDRLNEVCSDCGKTAVILIKNTAKPIGYGYGYYSENLDAYITSPKQKKRVMRLKNLEEY